MQVRRSTVAISLVVIGVLAGFNAYQAHVIAVQRQMITALYRDTVGYAEEINDLHVHLLQALRNLQNCLPK